MYWYSSSLWAQTSKGNIFEISFKDYFLLNPLIFIIILVVFLLRKWQECCSVVRENLGFPGGSLVKNLPSKQVWSLGWEYPLEKEMAPIPVFLGGKSHGQRSLMVYSLWCCKESDTTEWLSTHIQRSQQETWGLSLQKAAIKHTITISLLISVILERERERIWLVHFQSSIIVIGPIISGHRKMGWWLKLGHWGLQGLPVISQATLWNLKWWLKE